jgi:hypothetical protein
MAHNEITKEGREWELISTCTLSVGEKMDSGRRPKRLKRDERCILTKLRISGMTLNPSRSTETEVRSESENQHYSSEGDTTGEDQWYFPEYEEGDEDVDHHEYEPVPVSSQDG